MVCQISIGLVLAMVAISCLAAPDTGGGGGVGNQHHHSPHEHQHQHHQHHHHHPQQLPHHYGGGRGKKSGGEKVLDKIVEGPKGVILGLRRLKGGLVALTGGWMQGQASYLKSKRLNKSGQSLIELGRRIAGPGPYGPKAPWM